MLSLPLELKNHIVSFCSGPDLASMARVCSGVQASAEDALYNTLYLTLDFPDAKGGPNRAHDCLDSITQCPRTVSLVRSLHIGCHSEQWSIPWEIGARKLVRALQHPALVNLLHLRVNFPLWEPFHSWGETFNAIIA